jgi:hypothetical protein
MRRQMREMDHIMEAMMEPFGMMDPFFTSRSRYGQNMIENGGQNRNRQVNHHNHIQNDMMMPLGGGLFGGGLFGGVNRLMQQMVRWLNKFSYGAGYTSRFYTLSK